MTNSSTSNRHWSFKERARALRAQGKSYKEIRTKIPAAKSTISLWCRDVPLTKAQQQRLWEKRDTQLRGIRAIQRMFWGRRTAAFARGAAMVKRINADSRFLAGLMLYWGEGHKSAHSASIANSDPRIIRFMVQWFRDFFGITSHELKIYLHLHSGQDENQMKRYWSRLTGVPIENFGKSFVKAEGSGYRKNVLYNGTVQLTVRCSGSTYLLFQILGAISGFLYQAIGESIRPEDWMEKSPYA
ncbi:MAG: hypothetical protein V1723_01595 [Candidatus Uhrbacteria bacterium]